MMLAKELVKKMGSDLINRRVLTQPMGEWPGGEATVVSLGEDPGAPEIVMNVTQPGWEGHMGIFGYEEIELLSEEKATSMGTMCPFKVCKLCH